MDDGTDPAFAWPCEPLRAGQHETSNLGGHSELVRLRCGYSARMLAMHTPSDCPASAMVDDVGRGTRRGQIFVSIKKGKNWPPLTTDVRCVPPRDRLSFHAQCSQSVSQTLDDAAFPLDSTRATALQPDLKPAGDGGNTLLSPTATRRALCFIASASCHARDLESCRRGVTREGGFCRSQRANPRRICGQSYSVPSR